MTLFLFDFVFISRHEVSTFLFRARFSFEKKRVPELQRHNRKIG